MYPQAASLLFAYQQQGSDIVMITGADDVVAKLYANAFGIKEVISNRLHIKDERILGLQQPLCYGKGKVELASRFLEDRKSTRLNSSHVRISYAVFCLKKKKKKTTNTIKT